VNAAVEPARETRSRVAVIGSGVAGLTATHVIARSADVTLFEADDRLGGHADTHSVTAPEGTELAIDTGFIVHNERTYPTLLRLFRELGVATQPSEMSMSVRDEVTGLEYAGALGLSGMFPTWRSLTRPAYLRMLGEVPRFHRAARRLLTDNGSTGGDETLRDFLARGEHSAYFVRHFMEPLVAAVWSCDPAVALDYPARHLFTFLDHHGMLRVFGSPQWRTVTGGSREYVDRVAAQLADIRLGTKVTSVHESPYCVEVCDGNGVVSTYDAVVIATHPGQALAMLAQPTAAQQEVLSALPYSANTAQLHTDESLLPRSSRARASWNFLRPRDDRAQVTVTYDLTRLQRLPTERRYLVTLGGDGLVDPSKVIATRQYEHPLYTPSSVAAHRRLPDCDTARIALAGAYAGWGFHEDGARSGAAAAAHLGFTWPENPSVPATGRIYATTIRHTRRTPLRHAFTYRSQTWLVDLDHLPRPGPLASFQARDHLGSPDRTIRENVDTFLSGQGLAGKGIDLDGGRILMLASPRVLGYCFNPISIFWCHRPDQTLECVVVEVHNTYGERHAYVVHPDQHGKATVPKELYVSPFNDTSGTYQLALPLPGDRLAVSIALQPGGFTASMTGQASPRGRGSLAPLLVTLRIRVQGIRLWLRGMKVQPRPVHRSQEGVQ
jgi:predicted NAD/FAD-binding protein/DUF1365 family protein